MHVDGSGDGVSVTVQTRRRWFRFAAYLRYRYALTLLAHTRPQAPES